MAMFGSDWGDPDNYDGGMVPSSWNEDWSDGDDSSHIGNGGWTPDEDEEEDYWSSEDVWGI